MEKSRRDFIKDIGMSSAGLAIGGLGLGFTAKSYSRIMGSNERIRVAIIGTNSRGLAHVGAYSKLTGAEIAYICDVEDKALAK